MFEFIFKTRYVLVHISWLICEALRVRLVKPVNCTYFLIIKSIFPVCLAAHFLCFTHPEEKQKGKQCESSFIS